MPVSPDAQQMSQLQGQMDPQKLMALLAMLQMQNQPQNLTQSGQTSPQALQGLPRDALMSPGMQLPAPGRGSQAPPTLGLGQPIPMQMPQADPQGQQQGTPLPPNPTDMQM